MILCLYQIIVRVIEQRRILKRKQFLFLIILAADIFFLIFTMDRNLTFAYFLYFYFDQCFLIFLVYFFTKKATDLNVYNKSKTKLVRGCTYGLFAFFSILLLIDIIVYYFKKENCSYITLFVIRLVELFAIIIFITGAYYLNKKMNALIIEQIMFTNRMTGVEKTQYIKTRNIKLKFWTLVCVTAFGQIIQWVADLIYFINYRQNQSKGCELPAYNVVLKPWVDLLICFFGYFLPLFCAVYLFWFKKKQVQYVVRMSSRLNRGIIRSRKFTRTVLSQIVKQVEQFVLIFKTKLKKKQKLYNNSANYIIIQYLQLIQYICSKKI
ncbi:unnamed protein product [Paramecium sonneborni]|uniref:Uncharacterized protein n=1 Tax=Paramecium sonneborni TaxID=65129 RepID=A0A8S1PY26_9CILI|nr:unnamed protein product [Paramecium sonneborni]